MPDGSPLPPCPSGQACVGFVLPPDITTVQPEQVWHSCVSAADCTQLAAHHPDRFHCDG